MKSEASVSEDKDDFGECFGAATAGVVVNIIGG
jgi:hypothetical protein